MMTVVAAGALLCATACAPFGPSDPHLQGTLSVNGDYDIETNFDIPAPAATVSGPASPAAGPSTCADYAKGGGTAGTFELPSVEASDDTTLYLTAQMTSGYTGPRMYTNAATPGLTGQVVVSTSAGQGPIFTTYRSARGGSSRLRVNRDGSGTLSFSDWGSTETRGTYIAGFIDGVMTWTCHD